MKEDHYFILVNASFTPMAINTAPIVRSNQCPIRAEGYAQGAARRGSTPASQGNGTACQNHATTGR